MNFLEKLGYVYKWHKDQFWFLNGLTIVSALFIHFVKLDYMIEMCIIMFTMIKVLAHIKLLHFIPSSVNDQEHFSWKYLQSLPLTKKDLFHFMLLAQIFCYVPALIWLTFFHTPLFHIFDVEVTWEMRLAYGCLAIFGLLFISVISFNQLIVFPRKQFTKISRMILLLQTFRDSILAFVGVIVAFGLTLYGAIYLRNHQPEIWKALGIVKSYFWNDYIAVFYGVAFMVYLYRSTFKGWIDEKKSYPKKNWKPLRDVPLIAGSVALLIFTISQIKFPDHDGGTLLTDAVIDGKAGIVEELVSKGADINKPNKNGFTPLMTAANRGNHKMFLFLESLGAKRDGIVANEKIDRFNGADIVVLAVNGGNLEIVKHLVTKDNVNSQNKRGNRLLHIAAGKCHADVVDYILEFKPELNPLNIKGNTPLHVAAFGNCLPVSVSLMDAGANPFIKNKEQKLASDFGEKGSRYPSSYIERKMKKAKK